MYCVCNYEISIYEDCFFLMLIILKKLYERDYDMCSYTDCDAGPVGITEILGDVLNKTESSLDIEGLIAKMVDIFHV